MFRMQPDSGFSDGASLSPVQSLAPTSRLDTQYVPCHQPHHVMGKVQEYLTKIEMHFEKMRPYFGDVKEKKSDVPEISAQDRIQFKKIDDDLKRFSQHFVLYPANLYLGCFKKDTGEEELLVDEEIIPQHYGDGLTAFIDTKWLKPSKDRQFDCKPIFPQLGNNIFHSAHEAIIELSNLYYALVDLLFAIKQYQCSVLKLKLIKNELEYSAERVIDLRKYNLHLANFTFDAPPLPGLTLPKEFPAEDDDIASQNYRSLAKAAKQMKKSCSAKIVDMIEQNQALKSQISKLQALQYNLKSSPATKKTKHIVDEDTVESPKSTAKLMRGFSSSTADDADPYRPKSKWRSYVKTAVAGLVLGAVVGVVLYFTWPLACALGAFHLIGAASGAGTVGLPLFRKIGSKIKDCCCRPEPEEEVSEPSVSEAPISDEYITPPNSPISLPSPKKIGSPVKSSSSKTEPKNATLTRSVSLELSQVAKSSLATNSLLSRRKVLKPATGVQGNTSSCSIVNR